MFFFINLSIDFLESQYKQNLDILSNILLLTKKLLLSTVVILLSSKFASAPAYSQLTSSVKGVYCMHAK